MSDSEEHVEPQKKAASIASTADNEATADIISIPQPSEEAEESDITLEQDSEIEALTESEETTETRSERSTRSTLTTKSSEAKPREEVVSAENVPQVWEEEQKRPESQSPEEGPMQFLNEIKTIKENLQASIKESSATGSSYRRPDILFLGFKG